MSGLLELRRILTAGVGRITGTISRVDPTVVWVATSSGMVEATPGNVSVVIGDEVTLEGHTILGIVKRKSLLRRYNV
jgi:hypothetical protein